jgi:hypothetical protein
MWVVGTLRGKAFNRIPASPEIRDVSEARQWAAGYAKDHSDFPDAQDERLAWRFLEAF